MKFNVTLAASLFATVAALSFNVGAAADTQVGAKAAPNAGAEAKAEKAVHRMNMGPHSHAEVKTGFPQKAPEAMPDKPNPAKDMSKHFHPRDGK